MTWQSGALLHMGFDRTLKKTFQSHLNTTSWRSNNTICENSFNETIFVTSSQALDTLQLEWGDASEIGAIALMSDGTEESLFNRQDQSFAPALGKMAGWLDRYTEKKVREALSANLHSTLRQQSMDDLSIALLRFTD